MTTKFNEIIMNTDLLDTQEFLPDICNLPLRLVLRSNIGCLQIWSLMRWAGLGRRDSWGQGHGQGQATVPTGCLLAVVRSQEPCGEQERFSLPKSGLDIAC